MICIFLIEGSNFIKKIPKNNDLVKKLQKEFIVKTATIAQFDSIEKECLTFFKDCSVKYTDLVFGIIGLSSGGYFALRLKKKISKIKFCIAIAPVINPKYRCNYMKNLPENVRESNYNSIINNTPNVRKIYNKIDNETFIILGEKDKQVPITMFDSYKIPNILIVKDADHSIANHITKYTLNLINAFIYQ